MQLEKLKIKNFMSFRKVELDFRQEGLFLVDGVVKGSEAFGSNGAGKSSIFEALVWCLFGETIRGLTGNDIVNDVAKHNCVVSLSFICGKDKYLVVRNRKHRKYGNLLLLSGKAGASNKVTQHRINEIIGLDFRAFTNSVIFGQGNITRFSSASDRIRKQILEELLDLDYIPKAYDVARARLNDIADKNAQVDRESVKVVEQLNRDCDNRDKIRTLRTGFLKHRIENIQSVITTILDDDKMIAQADEIIMPHIDEQEVERLTKIRNNKFKLWEKLTDEYILLPLCDEEYNEAYGKQTTIQYEINSCKDKLSDLRSLKKDKVCSLCKQDIPHSHITTQREFIERDIKAYKVDLKIYKKRVNNLMATIRYRTEFEKKVEQFYKVYKKSIEEVNEAKHQRELRSERITNSIFLEQQRLMNMDRLHKACSYRIEEYARGINFDKDSELVVDVGVAKLKGLQDKADDIYSYLDYAEFWVEGFSNKGLKADIIDSVIPYLNERVGVYTDILTDGEIQIEFKNMKVLKSGELRDAFEVSCRKVKGGKSYKAMSGGEKKRVDLCQALALRDLVASRGDKTINFMFLDECFESLDDVGTDRVVDLLEELNKTCNCIYVATHISELKGVFPNTVTVVNKGGVSTIAS